MFEAKNSKSESLHALVWSVGEDDVRHVTPHPSTGAEG